MAKQILSCSEKMNDPMLQYRAYKQETDDLKNKASGIEQLIATKREEIAAENARIPDLSHLVAQRQDMHADLAMGKATDEQVATMDREIATKESERKEISNSVKQTIDAAEHAIAGLERRLEEISHEISKRGTNREQQLARNVLMAYAEGLGEEYAKAANQVKELYMRLMALSGLLKDNGHKTGIAPHCAFAMDITSFNLEACSPHEMKIWPGNLFLASAVTSPEFQNATDVERARLQDFGLDC